MRFNLSKKKKKIFLKITLIKNVNLSILSNKIFNNFIFEFFLGKKKSII